MIIHKIKITNFKSIYGPQEFVFDDLTGLVKIYGVVGSGKTSIAEAILYSLYGSIKGQNNPDLISWNTKDCNIEVWITSKNKEIYINRSVRQPLIVKVDGHLLAASDKRGTQEILEEDLFDVPKLAMIKMIIISFAQFNSLANMSTAETKKFLDEIFGFKLFSEYNDEIVNERKSEQNEAIKLQAIYDENTKQLQHFIDMKKAQQATVAETINLSELNSKREDLINKGVQCKKLKTDKASEFDIKINEINKIIKNEQQLITEAATLGRQAKNHYQTFKGGICPTCGQTIDENHINTYHNEMLKYAENYKIHDANKKKEESKLQLLQTEKNSELNKYDIEISDIKKQIFAIDAEIQRYNNNMEVINSNYDEIISEYENKIKQISEKLTNCEHEIGEWNEMNELFTKTLRYKLLKTLIPQINKSISFFINRLDMPFNVKYDEEFKAHITTDGYEKDIKYNNLSTGQKKTLDIAIIFGILYNIIANVDINILFLDELFSNLDTDLRNTMLELLNDTVGKQKSVFIINHAEMADDYFSHKIKVYQVNKIVENTKSENNVTMKSSKYDIIF